MIVTVIGMYMHWFAIAPSKPCPSSNTVKSCPSRVILPAISCFQVLGVISLNSSLLEEAMHWTARSPHWASFFSFFFFFFFSCSIKLYFAIGEERGKNWNKVCREVLALLDTR